MPVMVFIVLGWFVGGFFNGVAGFGAAMIAMPIVAPFIDLSLAVPSCTLIVLTLNIQVGWTFRKYIQWQYIKGIFIGAVPGVILSVFVLEYVSETYLKAGMGVFIACYALWSLYSENGNGRKISSAWGYLAGLLSSALAWLSGLTAPHLLPILLIVDVEPGLQRGFLVQDL